MGGQRPKGYADWSPKPDTVALVRAVQEVLEEYRRHLPLTVRQIFYRLVGAYGYDKTERSYNNLCNHLVRARRAQLIPFDAIRDDGTVELVPLTFSGPDAFWSAVRDDWSNYSRDRIADQDVRIELWCEAAGMVPQLQRVAFPYSVPVYSTGGFASVTVTHEIAERALAAEKPTLFLHVGDYDPSGESIFEAMSLDARLFLLQKVLWKVSDEEGEDAFHAAKEAWGEYGTPPRGIDLDPIRVALTEEQVEEHELETAPPKASDSRSASWMGDTCQAEAMPPDVLAATVEEAITSRLDIERYDAMRAGEESDSETIDAGLQKAGA